MNDLREALVQIMKICNESSVYSRRIQTIHETSMVAIGLTYNQRQERHIKAMMRNEAYVEQMKTDGIAAAKKAVKQVIKDLPEDAFSCEAPRPRRWVEG